MPPRKRTPDQETTEVQTATENAPEVQELVSANEAFAEENEQLRAELKRLKDLNITHEKRLESMEQQIGQDGTAHFDDGELIRVASTTLDDPAMTQKLNMEQFLNEMVTVEIHDVAEDQADTGFPIFVGGQCEMFFRGQQKTVKRKFVEGLARAKKTGYRNVERVDPHTGIKEYVYPSKTGLRYPFSVVQDPNKLGRDWLKAVLRQP